MLQEHPDRQNDWRPPIPELCGRKIGEVLLPEQQLSICASDRKDSYHQIRVPSARAKTNAIWPLLKVSKLQGTTAFQKWSVANAGGRRYVREAEGDFLGFNRQKTDARKSGPLFLLFCSSCLPRWWLDKCSALQAPFQVIAPESL